MALQSATPDVEADPARIALYAMPMHSHKIVCSYVHEHVK